MSYIVELQMYYYKFELSHIVKYYSDNFKTLSRYNFTVKPLYKPNINECAIQVKSIQ